MSTRLVNPIDIVLDTNVLVAGLRSIHGNSYKLLQIIGTGLFNMNVSTPLVLEYESVLLRHAPDFNLDVADIGVLIDYWCSIAIHRDIHYLWRPMLKDTKDEMVLELVVASDCKNIVTFNHKDFIRAESLGVTTISPLQFLESLGVSRYGKY